MDVKMFQEKSFCEKFSEKSFEICNGWYDTVNCIRKGEEIFLCWSGILLATNYCVWYETNGYFPNNVMLASRTEIFPSKFDRHWLHIWQNFVILCCNLFYRRRKKNSREIW